MKPTYNFKDFERDEIFNLLNENPFNPYTERNAFVSFISDLIKSDYIPNVLTLISKKIVSERNLDGLHVHVLANCPVDKELPELDLDNPVEHKYEYKKTFIGEGFMELMAQLQDTPLFSYKSRNNGDFYTDLVSFNKYKGKKTGFTGGDLIYHSDRSYHSVRADYVSLLGLNVPESQLIYTNYIDVKEIKKHLEDDDIAILKKEIFKTAVDDRSKESNALWKASTTHAILLDGDLIRYQDTFTEPVDCNDIFAIKAILSLKHAMSKSTKLRHMVKNGELLIFGNQTGIHNREWIDVKDFNEGNKRWLLKTYSFDNKNKITKYKDWSSQENVLCMLDK